METIPNYVLIIILSSNNLSLKCNAKFHKLIKVYLKNNNKEGSALILIYITLIKLFSNLSNNIT